MSACPAFNHLVVLPHLHVQNANAVSSPLTHGFPSMTAFLGFMWALERKTRAAGLDASFKAVGVVCHDHDEQLAHTGYVQSFRLTRNPVGKDGKSAAIVEEGRIHMDVSVVLAVDSPRWARDAEARQADIDTIAGIVATMRVAGGTMVVPAQPWRRRNRAHVVPLTGTAQDQADVFRRVRMRLLPGFTLVLRDDCLSDHLDALRDADPETGKLDAWLSLSRVEHRYVTDDKTGKGEWVDSRPGKGWLVPIPVGYGGLGELHAAGTVANARDADTPFRFTESLYSIGEWLSPHRLQSPQDMLWYADSEPDNGLYRCRNDYAKPAPEPETITVDDNDFDLSGRTY